LPTNQPIENLFKIAKYNQDYSNLHLTSSLYSFIEEIIDEYVKVKIKNYLSFEKKTETTVTQNSNKNNLNNSNVSAVHPNYEYTDRQVNNTYNIGTKSIKENHKLENKRKESTAIKQVFIKELVD